MSEGGRGEFEWAMSRQLSQMRKEYGSWSRVDPMNTKTEQWWVMTGAMDENTKA